MPKVLQQSFQQFSWRWDFAKDGGALGTYRINIKPPVNSFNIAFFRVNIIAPASGPTCQIQYGQEGNSTAQFGAENEPSFAGPGGGQQLAFSNGNFLTFTIINDALTQGNFILYYIFGCPSFTP